MTLTETQIREYDDRAMDSEATATATFGIGCFWGPDARFGAMDGVVRTRVGYAGGTKIDPTYHSLGDHTEVFQVEFDPDTIPYRDLLNQVFDSHNPQHQTRKTQYQNIVFAATEDQRAVLDEFLTTRGLTADGIGTRIEQLSRFYPAEDYHQKYKLRSVSSFMDAFEAAGYSDDELRESPIAAKLNGYAAGHDVAVAEDLSTPDHGTA
ncbi:peptide-methionine (S)-S-oxide reductase [Halorubrum sp. BOL3-1]|uniref:peptide-methionine (S)-S-oxide reductase MsrA n=1 Tax=Halorubrum sp. BOL3-1 TaxID=2497325 RepID=UPI001004F5AB|nr:peptide-methionine (S)-S-oxide reductase [Halorubrum sp. BOL3-1]QAU11494.1 peptide-methionine (S)-S-oxide reductase [Halorubrum sp. BOL3-1]